jgi:hypothetical protein
MKDPKSDRMIDLDLKELLAVFGGVEQPGKALGDELRGSGNAFGHFINVNALMSPSDEYEHG